MGHIPLYPLTINHALGTFYDGQTYLSYLLSGLYSESKYGYESYEASFKKGTPSVHVPSETFHIPPQEQQQSPKEPFRSA